MNKNISALSCWTRAILEIASTLIRTGLWAGISNKAKAGITVKPDFFGINIATANDPEIDDYIIKSLHYLGIQQVRLSFSYDSFDNHKQRLLDRVIVEGFEVLLVVFPPIENTKILSQSKSEQQNWQLFLEKVFKQYHTTVTLFEIGNTTNRKKWSGFTFLSYLHAWSIAQPLADQYNVKLAGANISDFEPFYNLAYLKEMKNLNKVPEVQTDNLFVERVLEPEAYDHRALGKWAKNILGLNLIKKARIIDSIGKNLGCLKTYCSYNCWTIKRLSRRNINPQQKQIDYLLRYLILAISSNSLDKVYWGPLICHRDGLIDCGADDSTYPDIDNVAYYRQLRGPLKDFQPRPAYYAMQSIIAHLSNSQLVQAFSGKKSINHFIFKPFMNEDSISEIHVCWCRDGHTIALDKIYPQPSSNASYAINGFQTLETAPLNITEEVLFITFSDEDNNKLSLKKLSNLDKAPSSDIIVSPFSKFNLHHFTNINWQGVFLVDKNSTFSQAKAQLLPESLEQAKVIKLLRDKRNKIWNINTEQGMLSVKLNRTVGIKRFTYRFQLSKAKRHWNNANAMLRRSINTPQPIAFFENKENTGTANSYYVTKYIENAFSARDIFYSINQNENLFKGKKHSFFLDELAKFISKMHLNGVLHRDLSSGNILLTLDNEKLTPYLIDIGRARLFNKLSPRQRLIDLMRINYKLPWHGREQFMKHYQQHLGLKIAGWRWAVRYYECKQKSKKFIKGKR